MVKKKYKLASIYLIQCKIVILLFKWVQRGEHGLDWYKPVQRGEFQQDKTLVILFEKKKVILKGQNIDTFV